MTGFSKMPCRFHLNMVGGNYFEVDQLIWLDEPKIDQIFHHIIRSFFYEIKF